MINSHRSVARLRDDLYEDYSCGGMLAGRFLNQVQDRLSESIWG